VGWTGETVVVSVRLPRPVVDSMDDHIGEPFLPDRSACVQDAMVKWTMVEERRA
jgi:Arc/MetJ-type ribon-helix-helix transcriptional regulator